METLIQSQASLFGTRTLVKKTKSHSAFWATAEEMRFGLSPAILTFVVCINAIFAAYAITKGVTQLAIVGFPTAIFICTIIAVNPMKVIFSMAVIALLSDVLMLFIQ